jgi:hypothetical protein
VVGLSLLTVCRGQKITKEMVKPLLKLRFLGRQGMLLFPFLTARSAHTRCTRQGL